MLIIVCVSHFTVSDDSTWAANWVACLGIILKIQIILELGHVELFINFYSDKTLVIRSGDIPLYWLLRVTLYS